MIFLFASSNSQIQTTLNQSTSTIQRTLNSFVNTRSIVLLLISLFAAIVVGRIISMFMRRLINLVGRRADKANTLETANRLRRVETYLVLSVALIHTVLIIFAVYIWWILVHPATAGQATAIISAATIITLLLSGAVSAPLRDYAFGAGMMAEHWYGVGDYISIDQVPNAQGVVERVTLRSTRIRNASGQIIWVTNQNIAAARITPRGIITMALEIFVTDIKLGEKLIEDANMRLPTGPLAVVTPFNIISKRELAKNLWHITAIAETAPGREWFIDTFAIKIIQDLNEEANKSILIHDPITRYADLDAERRFARSIQIGRKITRRARTAKHDRTNPPSAPSA